MANTILQKALSAVGSEHQIERSGQLGFNYDRSFQSVSIFPFSEINGRAFLSVLKSFKPKYLIDTRVVARFDDPNIGRARLLHSLHESGTSYLRDVIDWASFDSPFMAVGRNFLPTRIDWEVSSDNPDDIFFLVPKLANAQLLGSAIRMKMEQSFRSNYEIVIFR